MEKHIYAPWKKEQVEALKAFQSSGFMHPFTCGRPHPLAQTLVPTTEGWMCPDEACDYTQEWAHSFMADPRELEGMERSWTFTCSGANADHPALKELRRTRKVLRDTEDELAEARKTMLRQEQQLKAMRIELVQLNGVVGFYQKQRKDGLGRWSEDVDTGGVL